MRVKPLMGVVLAGNMKNYAIPKFIEMLDKWVDCDVIFATEYYRPELKEYHQVTVPNMGCSWATEMVYYGRWALNDIALSDNYTHMIWQGIDCYYNKRDDIKALLYHAQTHDIVGGLVAGRNRADYPVCRDYNKVKKHYTEQTTEINPLYLRSGNLLAIHGYIGSDATVISRRAMEEVTMDGYVHWHDRREIPGAFGPEEYFMWSALEHTDIVPHCDTSVRPWHAHETGHTVRYSGEACHLDDLRF